MVHVKLNEGGLSLVEVLIAMVISLLVSLSLMQTALLGIDSNMRNVLRDEAVHIAETRTRDAWNRPFVSMVSDASAETVSRDVRNATGVTFNTTRTVTEIDGDGNTATDDGDIRRITVAVTWQWKGENFTHTTTTIRKR